MIARQTESQLVSTKEALASLLLGWILFVGLSAAILQGQTNSFDLAILENLVAGPNGPLPRGPLWLIHAARDLTSLGSFTVLFILTIFLTVFLALAHQPGNAIYVAATIAGGWLCSQFLKHWIDRTRPSVLPRLVDVGDGSFPSGHALVSTVAFFVVLTLAWQICRNSALRSCITALAALLIVLIEWSRIYLGAHYPTDVLGGWCFGVAWSLTCALILKLFVQSNR